MAPGQRLEVASDPARRRRPASKGKGQPVLRYADPHIVVVDKPAGLTTVRHRGEAAEFGARARRFLPPTLADLLPALLGGGPRVRAVHRLDKETTGLVVFARTPLAERKLGQQFRGHEVGRRYFALVRGQARAGRIESCLVADRGDGRRGSGRPGSIGKQAITHVQILEPLGQFTLVECRLETGRTHQVRIHLAEAGTPLCGERVYDRAVGGKPAPDGSGMKRPALHAATLELQHPATGKRMAWQSALPDDMRACLNRLKRRPARTRRANEDGNRRNDRS